MEITKLEDFKNISYVNQFPKEWNNLFKNDKRTKRHYDDWLYNRLSILDENPVLLSHTDTVHFEDVTNSHPKIYSIHGRSKKNPRVLYYLVTDNNKVVLLSAFIESKGSDYRLTKQKTEERAKQLIKGEYYEGK